MADPSSQDGGPIRPKRDWIQVAAIAAIALAGVPGVAAFIALIFNYQQVNATNVQLQIAAQGLITDRYNSAIANLGSRSIEVRLGGIYALQRLMQDSPREQPTIIEVLCAFVRDQSSPAAISQKLPTSQPPTDIQAALTVVGSRNTANDDRTTVLDFAGAQLADAQLNQMHLYNADFSGATLTRVDFLAANLRSASFFHVRLNGAILDSADLAGATLTGANLSNAKLLNANLDGATITGANLTGANLDGATLTGMNLTGANLTDAEWPLNLQIPAGWARDSGSDRLERANASP